MVENDELQEYMANDEIMLVITSLDKPYVVNEGDHYIEVKKLNTFTNPIMITFSEKIEIFVTTLTGKTITINSMVGG
eukprot:1342912-Amphidinium_carterae.1